MKREINSRDIIYGPGKDDYGGISKRNTLNFKQMKNQKVDANELMIGNALFNGKSNVVCSMNAIDIQNMVNGKDDEWRPVPITLKTLSLIGFTGDENEMSIPLPTGDGVDLSIEFAYGTTCLVRKHTKKLPRKDTDYSKGFDYCYIKHPKYIHNIQNLYYLLSGVQLDAFHIYGTDIAMLKIDAELLR